MKHVAAHRLASYRAGTIGDAPSRKIRLHIDNCSQCSARLARIDSARTVMDEISTLEPPEVGWDHIATRIYWSTSSDRRAKSRTPGPRWKRPVAVTASVAVCAAIGWSVLYDTNPADQASRAIAAEAVSPLPTTVDPVISYPESADALQGMITFAQDGASSADGTALVFDHPVVVGSRYRTEGGTLVVQFGPHSLFRVGPHSELLIHSFDSNRIELEISGLVDVDIERRPPGQEFVVVAGDREVLVRGTAFRVDFREDELDVSCTRGKVVVKGDQERVDVSAGQVFRENSLRVVAMQREELALLEKAMAMPVLLSWNSQDPLQLGQTSVLDVSADETQLVAVDGLVVSNGSFRLRTTVGRHQIAQVNGDGSFVNQQWIGVRLGEPSTVLVAAQQTEPPKQFRSVRRQELKRALNSSSRQERCLAPLVKQRLLAGSYIEFSVGINVNGSLSFLNVGNSNLSPTIQRCLRSAIDAQTLSNGPAAEFRLRLAY